MSLKKSLLKINTLVIAGMFMFNVQAGTVSSTLLLEPENPDISVLGLQTEYNLTTGVFTADHATTGLATSFTLKNAGVNTTILNGEYSLTANIQAGMQPGTFSATGDIIIRGTVGSWSGDLLVGTLAQIGGVSMALNFIFNVDSGAAASLFGDTLGVVMSGTGYNTISSFGTGFDLSNSTRSSDNFAVAVPAPGTLALILIGFAGLALRRNTHV